MISSLVCRCHSGEWWFCMDCCCENNRLVSRQVIFWTLDNGCEEKGLLGLVIDAYCEDSYVILLPQSQYIASLVSITNPSSSLGSLHLLHPEGTTVTSPSMLFSPKYFTTSTCFSTGHIQNQRYFAAIVQQAWHLFNDY